MNDKRGRGLSGATLLVCVALLFAALWFTNQIDQRDKQITTRILKAWWKMNRFQM